MECQVHVVHFIPQSSPFDTAECRVPLSLKGIVERAILSLIHFWISSGSRSKAE